MEEYRKIDGYDNYSISNLGNVRNDTTNKILKYNTSIEYIRISLRLNNVPTKFYLHRLLALTFIPNSDNKTCVDHIDNNKRNNNLNNLRWATYSENNHNRSMSKNNKSGVKGVSWIQRDKRWCATIMIDGEKKYIGYYDNLEDAKVARQLKAAELFGTFTNVCEN